MREFVNSGNGEQFRYAADTCKIFSQPFRKFVQFTVYFLFFLVGELCHLFTNYLVKNKVSCIHAVSILQRAVLKIRFFDSQLTSVHADLCQLSLVAKVFDPALQLLDIDITGIASTEVRCINS